MSLCYHRIKRWFHYNTLIKNRFLSELCYVQLYFKSSYYVVLFLTVSCHVYFPVRCNVLELIYTTKVPETLKLLRD
jgi:hypothetical protein